MSSQNIFVLSTFFVLISFLMPNGAHGYGNYGGSQGSSSGASDSAFGSVAQTQERRASERFDIISWIRGNQQKIAAQNSRYGGGGSGGIHAFTDFVFTYMQDSGTVTRDGATLGKDTRGTGRFQFLLNDLFTRGNRERSLNIDLGLEGYMSQTLNFVVDPTATQTFHTFNETGGALLIRPIGRSSQDSGLTLKGGYMNMTETGLWANTQTNISLYDTYLGAEAKLYLLPFLGIRGEYQSALEKESDVLQGKWKMQRFTYGAFIELYLLNVGAYLMNTEMELTPDSGSAPVKEVYSGAGASATLHF